MSSPITQQNPTKVSQQTLARSDALRAAAGLPPLERQANVQVVKGTQSSQPQGAMYSRSDLAAAQGRAAVVTGNRGGEAVSFMRFPFTPNKGSSSNGIQSTTIADALQFVPVSAGVGIAERGVSPLANLGKQAVKTAARSQTKTASKIGSADIGLNVKSSEAFKNAQRFNAQVKTLPKPGSVRPPPNPPSKPNQVFNGGGLKEEKISLGMGIGRMIKLGSKGEGAAVRRPSTPPPTKPSFDPFKSAPKGKEVSAGKGLVQIVRQTQEVKPQVQKPIFKEYPISLGKSKPQIVKVKPQATKAQQETQKYLDTLQARRLKANQRTEQTQEQIFGQQTKQTQKQEEIFGQITKQTQKQRQETIPKIPQKQQLRTPFPLIQFPKYTRPPGTKQTPKLEQPQRQKPKIPPIIPVLKIPKPTPKTPPTKTPEKTGKNQEVPPGKKKGPFGFLPFLPNPLNGGGGAGGGGGAKKSYTGNVPQFSFTGMYNRSETIYGKVKTPKEPKGNRITRII